MSNFSLFNTLKDLAVTGKDLLEAGVAQGKEIGEKLDQLLETVIEEPELNTLKHEYASCFSPAYEFPLSVPDGEIRPPAMTIFIAKAYSKDI